MWGFVFSFSGKLPDGFLSNFRHSLHSTALSLCIYKPNVLPLLFSYKLRILVKIRLFWLFWGAFWIHFLPPSPDTTTESSPPRSATSCITYQRRSLSVCNRTISTFGHGICLLSERNFKHCSSPFPLFPTDKRRA